MYGRLLVSVGSTPLRHFIQGTEHWRTLVAWEGSETHPPWILRASCTAGEVAAR